MCKNPSRVIAEAKRDTPDVVALYEGKELVGLCKVYNESLAVAYDITKGDELSYFCKSAARNVTNIREFVRRLFGVDKGFDRHLYRVAVC